MTVNQALAICKAAEHEGEAAEIKAAEILHEALKNQKEVAR